MNRFEQIKSVFNIPFNQNLNFLVQLRTQIIMKYVSNMRLIFLNDSKICIYYRQPIETLKYIKFQSKFYLFK